MRITDEARELHKFMKAAGIEIERKDILNVLQYQSDLAVYKLTHGEPFSIFKIGTITPRISNGTTRLNSQEKKSYTTVKFPFKVHSRIKMEAKKKIPKEARE